MVSNKPSPSQSSEQESLLIFPCMFTFKAMLKNSTEAEIIVATIVDKHVTLEENALSSALSKKKNYVSVSCTAHLENEKQLKKIYKDLKNHPSIVMTL